MRGIFKTELEVNSLKMVYKKITTNPDSTVDWSELFGIEGSVSHVDGNLPGEVQEEPVRVDVEVGNAKEAEKDVKHPVSSENAANLHGAIDMFDISAQRIIGDAAGVFSLFPQDFLIKKGRGKLPW